MDQDIKKMAAAAEKVKIQYVQAQSDKFEIMRDFSAYEINLSEDL